VHNDDEYHLSPRFTKFTHTCGKIRAVSVGPEQAVVSFSPSCGTRRPCFPVPVLCAAVFFTLSLSSLLGFSGPRACLRVAVVFLPLLASVITLPWRRCGSNSSYFLVPILFVRTHAHRGSAKPRNRSHK
jgi:hypothetical protein